MFCVLASLGKVAYLAVLRSYTAWYLGAAPDVAREPWPGLRLSTLACTFK